MTEAETPNVDQVDQPQAEAEEALVKHLAIYNKERTGLSIWRAYAIFRKKGLPVPEQILAQLDLWAARLEGAGKHREIADAIDMTADNGHVKGAKRLGEVEQAYELVIAVQQYLPGSETIDDAVSMVDEDTGHGFFNVRSKYFDWKPWISGETEPRKRSSSCLDDESAGLDLAKEWMKAPVSGDS